jgi:integrase/recombinase XerC
VPPKRSDVFPPGADDRSSAPRVGNDAAGTELERRDRAQIAFAMIPGARIGALATFRLGNVDMAGGFVDQDARVVRTKAAKTFRTYFMPVDDDALAIVRAWIDELTHDRLFARDDPLFPATEVGLDPNGDFVPVGLSRRGWAFDGPARDIFRRAFAAAGLPYYNPHSFRSMLVRHAMGLDLTPEEMKAWSQNLGHSNVATTFTSYGTRSAASAGSADPQRAQGADCRSPYET